MQLPFTNEQFFDLLAAYNAGLWPALVALLDAEEQPRLGIAKRAESPSAGDADLSK